MQKIHGSTAEAVFLVIVVELEKLWRIYLDTSAEYEGAVVRVVDSLLDGWQVTTSKKCPTSVNHYSGPWSEKIFLNP